MKDPVKLIDFGCAVTIGSGINAHEKVGGTFQYMAPEVIKTYYFYTFAT